MDKIHSGEPRPIIASITYMANIEGPAIHHIYPRSSGKPPQRPPNDVQPMEIFDRRTEADRLSLDIEGFAIHRQASAVTDFFDEETIKRDYYPEVEALVRNYTGAFKVVVFDHNIRSRPRAESGEDGIREPVRFVHNDYTAASGPKRVRDLVDASEADELLKHRFAFINVWRPIHGPVQDKPLAVCDARSMAPEDFVATEIRHYGEGDIVNPRHRGEIYSVCHNPRHRWYFVSNMQSDEVMLLKCYDSLENGPARFTAHTAVDDPNCPPDARPRESIEVRTVAFFSDSQD